MADTLRAPVVLIIFNRAELTAQIFAAIRAARPSRLFIIADGPRLNGERDQERCAATRAVTEEVDWPCHVFRKFAETNLGLRRNVSEGLDWVFCQTPEAIILEDDCLPDPTFFLFCDAMLERYRDNSSVGMISGTNPVPAHSAPPNGESYYFSRYCYIWGWATWRHAWRHYDREMNEWPALRKSGWLKKKVGSPVARNFWRRHFDDCFEKNCDGLNTWDVQLVFAFWRHNLLSIVPQENLVSNLGFGAEAAHTKRPSHAAKRPMKSMAFPLRHPGQSTVNEAADDYVQEHVFQAITPLQRWYWKLRLPIPIWVVRRALRWAGR